MSNISKAKQTERDAAKARITDDAGIKHGDTIRCILRHVSASGMSRVIDLVHISSNGDVRHIGFNAAEAIGWTYDRKREGVKVSGYGMDMGFHLVSTLSRVLFGDDYSLESRWL